MTQNSQYAEDVICGTINDDLLLGTDHYEEIGDYLGHVTAYGGAGDDFLGLGVGNDVNHGGAGRDTIFGGEGSHTLDGGAENDVINGFSNVVCEWYPDELVGLFDLTASDFIL